MSRTPRKPTARRRKGGAVVELTVCLPIIALVVFGAIEAAGMIFLKQALVQTAYEAAKVSTERQGTEAGARNAAAQVTDGRKLKNVKVEFVPSDLTKVKRGEKIRVIVSAPADENSLIKFGFYRGRTLSVEAVMQKE